jgi:capsular exopolysaccharide synthesis family protein
LQIDRELPKVLQFQEVVPVESALDKDFYQTQYELLRSRTLAKRVIDQLSLEEHAKGALPRDASVWTWFDELVGGGETVDGTRDEHGAQPKDSAAVDRFLSDLRIEPVKQSRLVKVSFDSRNAGLSATVVNTLTEGFIRMSLERRMDASSYAKGFIDERLTQVKAKLEDSERKLVDFARENQIFKLDDSSSLHTQKLNELSQAVSQAERDRIDAEANLGETQIGDTRNAVAVLENQVIQRLKETRADLEAKYQDNLRIYKPGYPAMQQLRSQIQEIDAKIAEEAEAIRGGMQARVKVARQKERSLDKELTIAKNEALAIQSMSIQYSILQREVATNRQLYEGLLQRLKEVGVAGGVATNNISIVDPAEVPFKKFKPNLILNVIVGLILGVLGGVGLAFFLEHFDDSLKHPEDVERRTQVPVLGVVPEVKLAKDQSNLGAQIGMQAFYEPRSALAEAYRSIRTALLFSTAHGAPKVTLFTSPGPGEGKTTSALNLAITFTQTGSKVLLIDTDLRNPSLHRLLGLDSSLGLTNFLIGDAAPAEVSQHTAVTNLFAIPAGPLPPNPAELLSSARLAELLTKAAEKFDYVILDGPPVLGLADALVLSNLAGGTVIVAEAGVTRQGQLIGALKRLRSAHGVVLGCVLAKHRQEGGAYAYHQHYYYYQADDAGHSPPPPAVRD